MKSPSKSNLPAKLARGRERFEKWRSTHKQHTRFPGYLWSMAAKLACEYGINKTARTLRLDYNSLKKRVESNVSDSRLPAAVGQQFLQLLPSELTAAVECVIECEDAKGSKIHIHLKGRELPDLVALSSSLWNPDR
jgi:hypothetical protein